jgi:uncharacterized membrane protein YGL010W
MKSLVDQLSQYASYHRDRRNIATHLVGIPMIVVGIQALLGRPAVLVHGFPLTVAALATLASVIYYVALDRRYGAVMAVLLAASLWLGARVAAMSTLGWLLVAAGLFVLGWVVQFIGHGFEGKKPAFVDDLVGLLMGPLFIVAEVGFALGLRDEVRETVERRAGRTRAGRAEPSTASTG